MLKNKRATVRCGLFRIVAMALLFVASSLVNVRAQIDITCIQTATDKRDKSILAAHEKKSSALTASFIKRNTALQEAWGNQLPRERTVARTQAWRNFRKATAQAQKAYKEEVRKTWNQFKKDRLVCNVTESDEPRNFDSTL